MLKKKNPPRQLVNNVVHEIKDGIVRRVSPLSTPLSECNLFGCYHVRVQILPKPKKKKHKTKKYINKYLSAASHRRNWRFCSPFQNASTYRRTYTKSPRVSLSVRLFSLDAKNEFGFFGHRSKGHHVLVY